jgi:EAL domain-containing protein (putative c-di-GMP-specific phosphodiesterase class I)/GGDEF domain-containing protein
MSLIKQLWLAIIFTVTLATAGSFIFSMLSSKSYLEEQMQMKNIDNATSLALSISQMEKDPTVIDLLIAAQFDAGHYRAVKLVDPNGKTMSELINANSKTNAPSWFTQLLKIHVQPGVAEIQNGWKQFGQLTLESDVNFAYDQLWDATIKIAIWAVLIGFLACFIGAKILRKILTPLHDVVDQAQAIGDHRFITIAEPKTLEFKSVVVAMNKLSNRIKQTVLEESARLEALRFEINFEPITGLMNRDFFIKRVDASISHEEYFNEGVMVIAKLANLSMIDEHLGYQETNTLLKNIGDALEKECKNKPSLFAGRLNGTDFAVFSSETKDPAILGNYIRHTLARVSNQQHSLLKGQFLTSVAKVSKKDKADAIIKLIQNVMQKADLANPNELENLHVIDQSEIEHYQSEDRIQWLPLLVAAIDHKRVKLEQYPVINQQGKIIHYESPVRLQFEENGKWFCAGEFITWANKLALLTRIDTLVLETAIGLLKQGAAPLGINISANSIANPHVIDNMVSLISQHREIASKIYFEIPEKGVFNNLAAFKSFCKKLNVFGCKIGVEHFGEKISSLGELHDVGLNYIKIDVSVIRDIDTNEANKTLLRGICMIAHSIGVVAIAEGVQTNTELSTLQQIGVDGMTGPGISFISIDQSR